MARKVDVNKFGSTAPKLQPEDLEEDAAFLTVASYDEIEVEDEEQEGGVRNSATLRFEETGDKVVWLNKGMIETLVEQLGEDADKWIGQKIPVERHVAKFGNKKFPKVRVMPSEEWDKAFKDAGVRRSRGKK
jgi:hypothetical protein